MKQIVITDLNTALDALIASCGNEYNLTNISVSDDFGLHIKLSGEQWQGNIDCRVAEFIIRLQKDFLALYNTYTGELIKYDSGKLSDQSLCISFSVNNGSTEIFANLGRRLVDKVDAKHIIAILVIGGLIWGTVTVTNNINDNNAKLEAEKIKAEKEVQIAQIENKEKKEFVTSILEKTFEYATTTQSSFAYLAKSMQKEDTLSINNQPILTSKEAREVFKSKQYEDKEEEVTKLFNLDGDYLIENINVPKEYIEITMNRKKYKFSYINLDNKEEFFKSIPQKRIDVQLSATFTNGKFSHGFVVGVGTKRKDSVTLQEAIDSFID